ncbi:brain-specific angiogenesis inhibitor 1-associated protein 2-like protein 2 [Engraulis encrasicolus]|uniref:brain-specific angiogenesis inhibitor 1-associated protein 2-like protein 2 n=1 Tax=Engraulis encrasicolus TaxID=184585 RepID=UPI002FD489FC
MRTSHSMSNLLDQSGGGNQAAPPPPAPPPPSAANQFRPISSSADKSSERQRKPKSENHGPRHELFPKGTNPFATVKLKPTVTNDRSAPKF